jgi:hypothetical protein
MNSTDTPSLSSANPRLRIWPAIIIVALMWAVMKVPPYLVPDDPMMKFMGMMWGPIIGAGLFLIWWLLLSRTAMLDRWLILGTCLAIGGAAYALYHDTVGLFGLFLFALPVVITAWFLWLLITPGLDWGSRCAGLAVVLIAAWGYFATLRFDGIYGDFESALSYRWQPTEEKRFLAERSQKPGPAPSAAPAAELALQAGDWPAFRGANRDNRVPGLKIATDWSANPPREIWRHRVGPGWSSFAVIGNRLFTQEQRDKDEAVICYDADTGAEVWVHTDKERFEEVVAGAGPRATPTFHQGRLFTFELSRGRHREAYLVPRRPQ